MEVGVVYDPCADELYQAVRGFGAFVNGQRASSSDCTELGNAVVVRKKAAAEKTAVRLAAPAVRLLLSLGLFFRC